jgi:hypothetical protein
MSGCPEACLGGAARFAVLEEAVVVGTDEEGAVAGDVAAADAGPATLVGAAAWPALEVDDAQALTPAVDTASTAMAIDVLIFMRFPLRTMCLSTFRRPTGAEVASRDPVVKSP